LFNETFTAACAESPKKYPSDAQIRVLVVDDEPPVRDVLTSYLEKFDFEPLEATDGEEAWRTLESEKVDIVISDHQMPGLSGVELFHRIEATYPALAARFILITGTKHELSVVSYCREGRAAFLEKPFRLKDLSSILEGMVSGIKETPSIP